MTADKTCATKGYLKQKECSRPSLYNRRRPNGTSSRPSTSDFHRLKLAAEPEWEPLIYLWNCFSRALKSNSNSFANLSWQHALHVFSISVAEMFLRKPDYLLIKRKRMQKEWSRV